MGFLVRLSTVAALSTACLVTTTATGAGAQLQPSIHLGEGRLSIEVTEQPWPAFLKLLAQRTGITLHALMPLSGNVTASFEDVPVERALKRLFGTDASLLFVYEPPRGTTADSRLVEIWVLGPGQSHPASARAPVPVGRPAPPPASGQATYRPVDSAASRREVEDEQELSRLLADLSVPSAQVRREAATALGERGNEDALERLSDVLTNDQSQAVRSVAAVALGQIGSERALKVLRLALQDRDALVRRAAAQALVDIGGPDADAVLRDALRNGDREVRRIARESLDPDSSE